MRTLLNNMQPTGLHIFYVLSKCFSIWVIKKKSAGSKSVLHEVSISICISKHVLTEANSVLFLAVSQQTRENFALMRCISSFPVKTAWQDPRLISTNHLTNSLDIAVVCWCGKLSSPGVFTDWCSTLFEMLKPLVALHTTHPFLPVSLFQQLTNVSPSLKQNFTHARCFSSCFTVRSDKHMTHLLTSEDVVQQILQTVECRKQQSVVKTCW